MKKKIFVSLIQTLVLTFVCRAAAPQPTKIPRIGFLTTTARAPSTEYFRQGLRELGYVEGKNILIEYRYADRRSEPLTAKQIGLTIPESVLYRADRVIK
jgi:putative tryptophan/tyrosine transport system substrate-binding protein